MRATANYQADRDESVPRRIVNYLLWAAAKTPGRAVDLRTVAMAVLILPRKPHIDGKDVKRIRNAVCPAGKLMRKDHGRTIISVQGQGIRATVGSEDVATTYLEQKARQQVLATERLEEARGLIKMNELKTPEVRARVSAISQACRVLTSADVLSKLALPPKKDDDAGKA